MPDQDLPELLNDLEFECMTRAERFGRIGETEPEDPGLRALLEPSASHDDGTTVGAIKQVVDTLGHMTVTVNRTFVEVAKSLAFDLRVLQTLAEHVAEQQREIEELRRAVEDLRRGR